FDQRTAYEFFTCLEFRRVLFRSPCETLTRSPRSWSSGPLLAGSERPATGIASGEGRCGSWGRESRGRGQCRYGGTVLGLPDRITACLYDLDGVLTPTAEVHKAAWEETFNALLRRHADRTHQPCVPFDAGRDYNLYVDGRARYDGVRVFLASRGITLPEGGADDPGDVETVQGLGNRKN